jgi:SAM-dependent methyltransferase
VPGEELVPADVFDDDYLWFYDELLEERSDSEVELILRLLQGDMREPPFEGRFDALVNWFSSFGYFDDETNRRVLEGFARALRPGGVLLIGCARPVSRTWRPSTSVASHTGFRAAAS